MIQAKVVIRDPETGIVVFQTGHMANTPLLTMTCALLEGKSDGNEAKMKALFRELNPDDEVEARRVGIEKSVVARSVSSLAESKEWDLLALKFAEEAHNANFHQRRAWSVHPKEGLVCVTNNNPMATRERELELIRAWVEMNDVELLATEQYPLVGDDVGYTVVILVRALGKKAEEFQEAYRRIVESLE